MSEGLDLLIKRLEQTIEDDDFLDITYDVVEEIEYRTDAFDAVQPILALMEKHPSVDFGCPGPLVHFVEQFYKKGYEEKLIESLNRYPTQQTVWMLNRIINSENGDRYEYLMNVLDSIVHIPNLDENTLSLAVHFKTLQSE